MVGILFSYNGWYNTNNVAGEVKDPRRVLPLAIIIGLSLCMLVYLAVNWAYLYVMSIDEIAGSNQIAAEVAERLIVRWVDHSPPWRCRSHLRNLNANIIYMPRIAYGMAASASSSAGSPGYTPGSGRLSRTITTLTIPGHGVEPRRQLHGNRPGRDVRAVRVLRPDRDRRVHLRRKYPDEPRPFKVWGYPVTPLFFIVVSSVTSYRRSFSASATPCRALSSCSSACRCTAVVPKAGGQCLAASA